MCDQQSQTSSCGLPVVCGSIQLWWSAGRGVKLLDASLGFSLVADIQTLTSSTWCLIYDHRIPRICFEGWRYTTISKSNLCGALNILWKPLVT